MNPEVAPAWNRVWGGASACSLASREGAMSTCAGWDLPSVGAWSKCWWPFWDYWGAGEPLACPAVWCPTVGWLAAPVSLLCHTVCGNEPAA